MKNHILNTTTFTIRTESEIIAEVIGIETALQEMSNITNYQGIAVFFNDGYLNATTFVAWAKNLIKLINK